MILDEKFWLAISFLILVAAAFKPLKNFVIEKLDQRSSKIKSDIEEAIMLKEEAVRMLAVFQERQREIEKEIKNIINQAEEEAALLFAESKKKLEMTLNKRTSLAMSKINSYEKKAKEDLHIKALEQAIEAATLIIQEKIGDGEAVKTVEKAFSEIQSEI